MATNPDASFTSYNVAPYYNDFDENKKFTNILFVPGRAVQARELSQLQTIIQKQMHRFGSHIFKEGAMVIPGESYYDRQYNYLKLNPEVNSVAINVNNFQGRTILGTSSGALALVVNVAPAEGLDPPTLFWKGLTGNKSQSFTGTLVSGSRNVTNLSVTDLSRIFTVGAKITGVGIPAGAYISTIDTSNNLLILSAAATASGVQTLTISTAANFEAGETIVTVVPGGSSLGVHSAFTEQDSNNGHQGVGTGFSLQRGVFFAAGFFVLVDTQSIVLDKYSTTPSARVGLVVSKDIVTSIEDTSLNDPARGSPNENAPGANRLRVELTLTKFDYEDDVGENFIELAAIRNGTLQRIVTNSEYSELAKTFARRTFDESGNYTVRRFPIALREHLNDGTNQGYLTQSEGGDETKIAIGLEPGKAYVKGFEIETIATTWLEADKARVSKRISNGQVFAPLGMYIDINGLRGTFNITDLSAVELRDAALTFDSNNRPITTSPGSVVGSAKVRHFVLISGTPGTVNAVYRLWIFDVSMNTGKSFADDAKMVRLASATNAVGNIVLTGGQAIIGEPNNFVSIYPLNQKFIRTFRDADENIDTTYRIRRNFSGTMTGDNITLVSGTGESFAVYSANNYHLSLVTASATALGNGYEDGDVVNLGAGGASVTLTGSPIGAQVLITAPLVAGSVVRVIATLAVTGEPSSSEKTKTLIEDFSQSGLASGPTVQLGKADVFRLKSVMSGSNDVTSRFSLDTGQRDTHYARGRLLLKPGQADPGGTLTVTYDYFEHGNGDYFSVDSYADAIDYSDIPQFRSPTTGVTYDLRDCLDFRPRVNDTGSSFSVTGDIVIPNESITADYSYYMGRKDKVFVDLDANFFVVSGVASDNPIPPKDLDNAMALYILELAPYTANAKRDVRARYIENKRYTMRDIGKLEKRIENLEYYTSLSLLEKATSDLFIDDGTGNNRFKNGFVVDNFRTHEVGNATLADYRCAIDPERQQLRPRFTQGYVDLMLSTSLSSNYQKTGPLITLPYTEVEYAVQPYASDTENLNPYMIFPWIGTVTLDPPSDQWRDVETAPDLLVNIDNVSAIVDVMNQSGIVDEVFGVRWNSWQTEWVGESVLVSQTVSEQDFLDEGGQRSGTIREVTSITSTQVGQIRQGVGNALAVNTVTESLGERVVDVNITPFMRSRPVRFAAENLKPNTRMYPYFDGVPVAAYCRPILLDGSEGADGDPLVTDADGYIEGIFTIPNDDTLRFRVGQKPFLLVDDETNRKNFITSQAATDYFALGLLTNKETTILSTAVPTIVAENRTERQTITRTDRISTGPVLIDPLAQTFFVKDSPDGVFLTSIEIFFRKKGETTPVFLEIRNIENGYPGAKVVPYSHVTKYPSDIEVSEDGEIGTKFVFPAPVYLLAEEQYCFVVGAYNTEFEIWTARIGDFDVLTGGRISTQPYIGSLFKSQNLSTWTADQEQDIKFTINKARFTANSGTVTLVNEPLPTVRLPAEPFVTSSDSMGGVVTARIKNHGMIDGATVTISGQVGDVNGIPANEINGTHEVFGVTQDTVSFTTPTPANANGSGGSNTVYATKNIRADTSMVTIEELIVPNTSIAWQSRIPSVQDTSYELTNEPYVSVVNKENINYSAPHIILTSDNETEFLGGSKSAYVRGFMASSNEDISPVIDTSRMGLIAAHNIINNDDTGENGNQGGAALARYITKTINLEEAANDIRVLLASYVPAGSTIKVYYKFIEEFDTTTLMEDVDYVEMILENDGSIVADKKIDYTFVPTVALPLFTTFVIKIVMLSESSAAVPLIQDLRILALGT